MLNEARPKKYGKFKQGPEMLNFGSQNLMGLGSWPQVPSWADPGLPIGGAPNLQGCTNIRFCPIFQKKLHEIEEIEKYSPV